MPISRRVFGHFFSHRNSTILPIPFDTEFHQSITLIWPRIGSLQSKNDKTLGKNLIHSQRTSFGAKLVQDTESTMAASERVSTRNPVALTAIPASIFDTSGKQGRDSRCCGRRSRSHTTSGVVHDDG